MWFPARAVGVEGLEAPWDPQEPLSKGCPSQGALGWGLRAGVGPADQRRHCKFHPLAQLLPAFPPPRQRLQNSNQISVGLRMGCRHHALAANPTAVPIPGHPSPLLDRYQSGSTQHESISNVFQSSKKSSQTSLLTKLGDAACVYKTV